LWANIPLEKLIYTEDYDSILKNQHTYSIIEYNSFFNDSVTINLEYSEVFFLWTKLINASVVNANFESTYNLRVSDQFYYPNLGEEMEDDCYNTGISEIRTNGRYYQFNFNSKSPIIYDIGYNFIDVNFSVNDFQKFED
jgi:hypothetical protein